MKIKRIFKIAVILASFSLVFFARAQSFDKNLYFGIWRSADVSWLQRFLTEEKLYSGPITGNFLHLTREAVKKFQRRERIMPVSGYFGPKSRSRANAVLTSKNAVILEVPYISEAPSGNFTGPWKNACEEASIAMVEKYYLGRKSVGITEAEDFMAALFLKQDKLYGANDHSDASRTAEIINKYSSFSAAIKTDPTIEEIKNEIDQKRPVISMHRGFDLKNKNIRFAPTLSSYHMVVVIGYDDTAKKFITNDSGDKKTGAGHRYGYDLFMASLHDYDYERDKADGPARVIFTSYPKN